MDESAWRAERFEEHRGRLTAVAYRMLGSAAEAEDAVQEAWLRFSRSDRSAVENLGSWLTTVVSRVCLTTLQERRSRPQIALGPGAEDSAMATATSPAPGDPEQAVLLADSVGLALMIVLDTLVPAERVAFVLHDMFAVPFGEIAPIIGRSTAATRQLASRARRRVQGRQARQRPAGVRQAKLVSAFLAASREGDFAALLAVLDPDVVLRADEAAVKMGTVAQIRGARDVAAFSRRAQGARLALVNGAVGAVWMPDGRPRVVFSFTIGEDKITGIDLIGNPGRIGEIALVIPGDPDAGLVIAPGLAEYRRVLACAPLRRRARGQAPPRPSRGAGR
jgi:RNA polymerase sigma factor (sigma-70 family)